MDVFQNKLVLLKEAQKLDTFHPYETCRSATTLESPFFSPPAYGEKWGVGSITSKSNKPELKSLSY